MKLSRRILRITIFFTYMTWNEFDSYNYTWDEWDALNLTWYLFELYVATPSAPPEVFNLVVLPAVLQF